MGMRRGASLLAALMLLAGGTLAACGDDDEDTGGEETAAETTSEAAGPVDVVVTADEYSFELSETPTAPGEATFTLDNVGEEPHALIVARINEGFTLDEANELEGREGSAEILGQSQAGPGEQGKPIDAELVAGNYGLVCPLSTRDGESHYDLGQNAEFTIE
jgi:hypothetical protein